MTENDRTDAEVAEILRAEMTRLTQQRDQLVRMSLGLLQVTGQLEWKARELLHPDNPEDHDSGVMKKIDEDLYHVLLSAQAALGTDYMTVVERVIEEDLEEIDHDDFDKAKKNVLDSTGINGILEAMAHSREMLSKMAQG